MLSSFLETKAAPIRFGAALAAFSVAGSLLVACTPADERAAQEKGASSSAAAARATEHVKGDADLNGQPDSVSQFLSGEDHQQLSYYRVGDGMRMATKNEHEPRPALSLIKLYIATYVMEEGSFNDKYEALDMIANSSDTSAEDLFNKYPKSIDAIAKEYGLENTKAGDKWGTSVTSTYDVVRFVVQLMEDDPTHPVLVAMAHADSISEDGYEQDYGTAKLQNVVGTKWGWSNDKTLHSSVSFGKNFVVAASVTGSADDLTKFVKSEVTADNLREGTTRFHKSLSGEEVETTTASKTTITETSTAKKDSDKAEKSSSAKQEPSESKKETSAKQSGDDKKKPAPSARAKATSSNSQISTSLRSAQ